MNRLYKMAVCGLVAVTVSPLAGGGQKYFEPTTILARLRGTFLDSQGGRGVLSGDMSLVRFEITAGKLRAVGDIDGALADSTGAILGRVVKEVSFTVTNVASTCNQLSMDTGAVDIVVYDTSVRVEAGSAGYDSRDGGVPRSRDVLCRVADVLKRKPTSDELSAILNEVVVSIRSKPGKILSLRSRPY